MRVQRVEARDSRSRGGSPYFGRVARVLGYSHHSQVIFRFRDEHQCKLVAFLDAAVMNVDGAWPLLSQEPPQLYRQVLILKGV
jgi:hypothetical protein